MNGHPDKPPARMPVALMDILASHQMRAAVLGGLYQREKTGLGWYAEVSLLGSGLTALANKCSNALINGKKTQRQRRRRAADAGNFSFDGPGPQRRPGLERPCPRAEAAGQPGTKTSGGRGGGVHAGLRRTGTECCGAQSCASAEGEERRFLVEDKGCGGGVSVTRS